MTENRFASAASRRLIASACTLALVAGGVMLAGWAPRPDPVDTPVAAAAPQLPGAVAGVAKGPASAYAVVDDTEVAVPAIPMGDPAMVARIIELGKRDNKVMDHLTHLTTRIGPRLTGSTRNEKAREWAAEQFRSWGLQNVHMAQWGEIPVRFDRGPTTGKIFLTTERRNEDGTTSEPRETELREMQLTTLSWSAGTSGPVKGPLFKMPKDDAAYAALKDKLKGAWILMERPSREGMRGLRWQLGDDYRRRADARQRIADGSRKIEELPILERLAFDGVAGYITASRDERVWTGAIPGWREMDLAALAMDVHVQVRMSDYDCLNSRLADGDNVSVEIDAQNTFVPGPIACANVVAEIPGSKYPGEVIIMSGHIDSWDGPGSQGCTDNGTGSSVMMEAARLLMAAGVRPERTIRFILWDGEEQGLLGSTAYVKQLQEAGTLDQVVACFVDDGGTNFQGGVPALATQKDLLAAATAPVNGHFFDTASGKPLNVNVRVVETLGTGGGSDHASFNRAGIPGFYWDEKGRADYGYGWHTQNDTIALAIPEYLMQSATCSAVTAYNLACAPEKVAREIKKEGEKQSEERPRRGRDAATGGT